MNTLKKFSRSVVPRVKPRNFVHPDDHLVLEDESGRVKLSGSVICPSEFVTGIVMAVCGNETSDGAFLVHGVLVPDLPPQVQLPITSEDKYIIFISGLAVGGKTFNPLQFQLRVDHITGHLGDDKDQSMASKIVPVVIAGDSIEVMKGLLTSPLVAPEDQSRMFEPIKELDISLTQPPNRCLFLGASLYNTFTSCTNPHMFDLDGVCFVGTSGQNIDDLDKYSYAKDRLEFLERTLRWRHLAPTTPNTLGCYPFTDRDPFLIEKCPHVYVCGNQDKYETKVVDGLEGQRVRLICVPRFCESGAAVVLNTRNLECHALCLSTDFDL